MERKISLLIAIMVLALSMMACGQKEDRTLEETLAAEENTEQAVFEGAEEQGTSMEFVKRDTETEDLDFGFDVYANAEEKFQRLTDAYWDILDGTEHPGALFLEITQENIEKDTDDYITDDEEVNNIISRLKEIGGDCIITVPLQAYYGKRINDNEGWYDILDWLSQFDNSEEFNEEYIMVADDGVSIYSIHCYMYSIAEYAPTIANADEITFGEPVEEKYLYSGNHESAYYMPIIIDGVDYELYAIFDVEGNLINIDDLNSTIPDDKIVYTWEEDADYKQ